MNLLFQRSQSASVTGLAETTSMPNLSGVSIRPRFKLWAKVELDEDEQKVVDHYHFEKCVLIDSFQPELMRMTAYVAAGTFVLAWIIFWVFVGYDTGAMLATFAAAIAAYFYYDKNREHLFVKDLLHSRYFSCKSVIDLARKEAWLETITAFLRQVMESAKHWDGTEMIKAPVLDKDEAKRFIIKGL